MSKKKSIGRRCTREQPSTLKKPWFKNTFLLRLFPFLSPSPVQQPTTNDHRLWIDYWRRLGQSWRTEPEEQRIKAAVLMQGTDLSWAHLEGAILSGGQFSGANLSWAYLVEANLYGAKLDGAILRHTRLNGAVLRRGDLRGANLFRAQ